MYGNVWNFKNQLNICQGLDSFGAPHYRYNLI